MELYSYQRRIINFVKDKKRVGLFLTMGVGKTVITLTAIKELLFENKIKKCLIIAPLAVANNTWHTEIKKWSHLSNLKYKICTGSEKERLEAFKSDADIYIINRENVAWCYSLGFNKFGFIVVDESSGFKNHNSERFKCLKKFNYVYMTLLSGTPSPNGYHDLWSQIFLLDRGERLEKNITSFRNKYFISDKFGYNYTVKNEEEISHKISDITISLSREEILSLPKIIYTDTYVNLSSMDEYKEFKKTFVYNNEITAANAGVLTNKLIQFCNGAIYNEEKNYIEVHQEKLNALNTIIENNESENIIVAYQYKSDLERLVKKFPKAVVFNSKENHVEDWNKNKIKLLLCHPASSSMGLNLQFGGNIIVWFGLTWNLEHYLQFNARLHRQGQIKPVVINRIIAKNTIEEMLIKRLENKNITQNDLLNMLKQEWV